MATGNFYNVNANKIYACLLNQTDDETGDCFAPEYWEVENFVSEVENLIDERAKQARYKITSGADPHGLRSHSSRDITGFYTGKEVAGVSVYVNIFAVLRGAYYEGASLDWFMQIEFDSYTFVDETPADSDDICHLWESNLKKVHARQAVKYAEKTLSQMVEFLENIFAEVCEQKLTVVGRFSNGETLYSKIE